jgi:hypothetical protein
MSPDSPSFPAGATLALAAYDALGSGDPHEGEFETFSVRWSSSDLGVGTVSNDPATAGLAYGVKPTHLARRPR